MKTLTSAAQVRRAISEVLHPSRSRRTAAVAFVGADAMKFIPSPKGLILYCWPKAGGTNPHAIEELLAAGAQIRFVDRLHMKFYWSPDGGAVIGSANLTDNALGENGLLELGVQLRPHVINGFALTRGLRAEKDFEGRLRRLHREHVQFYQRNRVP